MRKRADVRSQSNRHTSCKLFPELLRMQVEQFLLALRSVGSCSVRGEVFRDGKRGHRKNMLFPHQPHGFVAKLKCVINGCNASLCSVQGPGLARCMHSHTLAYASGFVDSSAEFSLCVLIRSRKVSITNRIRTSLVNLDEIGALFELLAHCLDELICTVRVSGVRQDVLLGVVADGVFMSAEKIDRVSADSQARPWDLPTVNGIAHRSVSRAGAFRSHIALGREAGHEIVSGRKRRHDCSLWHGFLNSLQVFRAGMQEQMDMRINQSRQQRAIA